MNPLHPQLAGFPGSLPLAITASSIHGLVLLAFAGFVIAVCMSGKRARRLGTLHRHDRACGWVVLVIWFFVVGYFLLPANFGWGISLPLQLCDLANLAAALALLTGRRTFRVLLHFWAFGLSTQAFLTPTVSVGPSGFYFWLFWAYHFAVVGTAIYDVVVRRFRPQWRDCFFAIAFTAAYVVAVFLLNIAIDSNYGYVGKNQPGSTTVITLLGPWPLRVVFIAALGTIIFVLIQLIWTVASVIVKLVRTRSQQPSAAQPPDRLAPPRQEPVRTR